jgi:hypothetical protein
LPFFIEIFIVAAWAVAKSNYELGGRGAQALFFFLHLLFFFLLFLSFFSSSSPLSNIYGQKLLEGLRGDLKEFPAVGGLEPPAPRWLRPHVHGNYGILVMEKI